MMDYLFNLQEPGSLGALLIPALMVSGWVAEKVYPMRDFLAARRKAKAQRLRVEVTSLWRDKELAVDYLVLQGLTKADAIKRYDRWEAVQRTKANGKGDAFKVDPEDALDDEVSDLYA